MKKILEVLQYGDHDIRFNTDIKLSSDAEATLLLTSIAVAMVTKLWGGNEREVLAMIRALAIADLSVSVNRKEMLKALDLDSEHLSKVLADARKEMERRGIKVMTFAPGVQPPKMRS
ncbi:MAG: hypothetical protein J6X39_04990 [Bacteroidales bacterium]|nr:hypothetical protein [Bacteroidales bacterium]